jgi:hypothetical protein
MIVFSWPVSRLKLSIDEPADLPPTNVRKKVASLQIIAVLRAALSTLRQRISKELHGILFRGALFFPTEIRAYVRAFLAASLTGEPRLKIGQPDLIGPSVPADCRRMAALVIGAIDQETANA